MNPNLNVWILPSNKFEGGGDLQRHLQYGDSVTRNFMASINTSTLNTSGFACFKLSWIQYSPGKTTQQNMFTAWWMYARARSQFGIQPQPNKYIIYYVYTQCSIGICYIGYIVSLSKLVAKFDTLLSFII